MKHLAIILLCLACCVFAQAPANRVVTKNIPDGVVAAGNPCRVLREVSERDKIYYYQSERIDWEELK